MKITENQYYTLGLIGYGLLLIVGAMLAVFDVRGAVWVFGLGSLWCIVQATVYALRNKSDNFRIARLHRLNFVASLFLGIGTYLLYIQNNGWIVMVFLYAVLVAFLSFRGAEKGKKDKPKN